MGFIAWGVALPACLAAGWALVRRPVRQIADAMRVDRARASFRRQREWLEARFLSALGRVDPAERARWEDARWHDQVIWARDRQTRAFLALIAVHFPEPGADESGEPLPRHATALFEYRKGRWVADGKRLDEVRPDEAVLRNHRFEPVVNHPRRVV